MNKVIELPKRGRLIVVTDIHGNKDDFDKYIDIWDRDDPNCHILFTGDLIHEMDFKKYYESNKYKDLQTGTAVGSAHDDTKRNNECGRTG